MQSISSAEDLLLYRLEDLYKRQTDTANKIHSYTKLKGDLIELSQHSTKKVMIPLCEGEESIAFFTEGYLKHTNEVLVHLGAGYFTQRTAAECSGIIDRRLEQI
jgi:prefoldin subunit 5